MADINKEVVEITEAQRERAKDLLNGFSEEEIKIVLSTVADELLVSEIFIRLLDGKSLREQLKDIISNGNTR